MLYSAVTGALWESSTNTKNMLRRDDQYMYNATIRGFRANIVAVEKQCVLHSLSVFVVLVTQHAMRMRHVVICGLPRSKIFFHIMS
jgi:hypothetical protein